MTGAQAIIASLEAEGVDTVFGYPGGQAIKIYDALYDSKQIHHVLARHEQGAAHMADGYARATGQGRAWSIVTSGPGATNTVTGIATAYMDSIPMVVITGQVHARRHRHGQLPGVRHRGHHHARGQAQLPAAVHRRPHPHVPRGLLHRLHRPPRPRAHRHPERPGRHRDGVRLPRRREPALATSPPTAATRSQVKQAAELHPEGRAPPALRRRRHRDQPTPATSSPSLPSACRFPWSPPSWARAPCAASNPLNLGPVGMHGSKYANMAVTECDLLIAVGARFSDRVTGKVSEFAPHAKVIHIDIDPAEIGKISNPVVPIVGDAQGRPCRPSTSAWPRPAPSPSTAPWVDARSSSWRERWPVLPPATSRTTPMRIVTRGGSRTSCPSKLDPEASIVTTEVGPAPDVGAPEHRPRARRARSSRRGGLGTMGFGFPAAIGAAIGCPETRWSAWPATARSR